MRAFRLKQNFLRERETAAVSYFVARLSARRTPDQLTAFSIIGAYLAAVALVACNFSGWFVVPACAGLAINWYGDSLDGALARARHMERPLAGFIVDRGADVFSFTAMIVGFGFSPYFSPNSGMLLLLVYFTYTIYNLILSVIDGVQIIGLGGIGATEGRILIGVWAIFVQLAGAQNILFHVGGILGLDIFFGLLFAAAMLIFAVRLVADIHRIEARAEERRSGDKLDGNVVSITAALGARAHSGDASFAKESALIDRRAKIVAAYRSTFSASDLNTTL